MTLRTALAALALIFGLASSAQAIEGKILRIGGSYEVLPASLPPAMAAGIAPRGRVYAEIEFAKPECFFNVSGTRGSYFATGGSVTINNRRGDFSLTAIPVLLLQDAAIDALWVDLPLGNIAGSPFGAVTRLVIDSNGLPDDAIAEFGFPEAGQIENALTYNATGSRFQGTPGGLPVNIRWLGLQVEIEEVLANANLQTPACPAK
ncbi:MAG: hypothetical protein KDK10_15800 [Maritimibacter sp.]|nr:hypothetical protein [Maritimibacter sp.]